MKKASRLLLAFVLTAALFLPGTAYANDLSSTLPQQEAEILPEQSKTDASQVSKSVSESGETTTEQFGLDVPKGQVNALESELDAASPATSGSASSTNSEQEDSEEAEKTTYSTLKQAEAAGVVSAVPEDVQSYKSNEIIVVMAENKPLEAELDELEEHLDSISFFASVENNEDSAEAKEILATAADVQTESSVFLDKDIAKDKMAVVELPSDVTVADALLVAANDPNVKFAQPNFIYHLFDDSEADEFASASEQNSTQDLTQDLTQDSAHGLIQGSNTQNGLVSSGSLNPLFAVNDPDANDSKQWWLSLVNAYKAWDLRRTNQEVTIGIIDSGVRLTHEDIAPNLAKDANGTILAWDQVNNCYLQQSVANGLIGNVGDSSGHGTHVAGIAAAAVNNGKLGAGVSFNAKILPVLIFASGVSDTATCIGAMDYLLSKRAQTNLRVINMSFGDYDTSSDDPLFRAKIVEAKNLGIVCVAAAGNGNGGVRTDTSYPSDWDEVVSVVSVTQSKGQAFYSDYNQYKDIAAPGEVIYSTSYSHDSDFTTKSGTSMATPVVSGICALLFAEKPTLSVDELTEALYNTAEDLGAPGRDDIFGHGLVNARAALEYLLPSLEVKSKTTAKVYDGVPLTSSVTEINMLPRGVTKVEAVVSGSQTNVGSSINTIAEVRLFNNNIDVTGEYSRLRIIRNEGTLTVTQRALGITADSATKPYDGNALTKNSWRVTSGGIASGQTLASVVITGSQTNVGTSANVASNALIKAGNNDVSSNYRITYTNGQLTVTASTSSGGSGGSGTGSGSGGSGGNTGSGSGGGNTGSGGSDTGSGTGGSGNGGSGSGTDASRFDGKVVSFSSLLNNISNLDIPGMSAQGGTQLNLWQAHVGPNQRFRMIYVGNGYYNIVSVGSGLYLDVSGGLAFAGAKVIQWPKTGGNNQMWLPVEKDNGTFTLVSKLSQNFCLNISGGSSANGAKVILWPVSGGNNERFRINVYSAQLTGGNKNIVSVSSLKLFDINGASMAAGAQTIIWPQHGGANQVFNFSYEASSGYYVIKCVKSGLLLDVNGGSMAAGANVIQWGSNGGFNQRWELIQLTPGVYSVVSAKSGLALDVYGGINASGTKVITWPFHGGSNQQWRIVAA
ncbi:MAG: RICIN domain-containing protein [Coriobacteriales bacterium]|jgi:subtilisin family serine protease|nr:RICIN domain-containing protein [Coriobacteriales bacterium]